MNNRINEVIQKINEINASNESNSDVPSWYDDNGKFKHYVLGRYLLEHSHIKRIDNVIHIYDETKRSICFWY